MEEVVEASFYSLPLLLGFRCHQSLPFGGWNRSRVRVLSWLVLICSRPCLVLFCCLLSWLVLIYSRPCLVSLSPVLICVMCWAVVCCLSISSRLIFCCLTLSWLLSRHIMTVLSCLVLPCLAVSCRALSCPVMSLSLCLCLCLCLSCLRLSLSLFLSLCLFLSLSLCLL